MRTLNRWIPLALAAGLAAAQSLGSQEPAPQQPATQGRTHTVVKGDNLWDLSQTYLGNPFLWPEIYRLNRDVVEDPHWIYPGEVLRLPGEGSMTVGQTPTAPGVSGPPAAPPVPSANVDSSPPVNPASPTVFGRGGAGQAVAPLATQPPAGVLGVVNVTERPTVRAGQVLVAPYVDREGGPRGYGKIIKAADIPGVHEVNEKFAFQAYDRILISPPVGYVAPEGEKYLAVKLGPVLENMGQIVIPTGVVEVTRSARTGSGAVALVTGVFTEIHLGDRLIPIDTAGASSTVRPVKIADGPTARIEWIYGDPVLPSLQNYIVLNVSSEQGVRMGDEFIIYKPSEKPEEGEPRERETLIAKAQVVRSTLYGVTAVIIGQEQPSIKEGMTARVSAKMP